MGYTNGEGETEGLGLINAAGQHEVYVTAGGGEKVTKGAGSGGLETRYKELVVSQGEEEKRNGDCNCQWCMCREVKCSF